MDPEIERALEQQRQFQRQQRAAMQEVLSELRQDLLRDGADANVLREFELAAIDLAVLDVLERTLEERFKNLPGGGGSA